jgi:hypothetical protein
MKDCQILNVFLQSFLKKGKYFVCNKINKEILSSELKFYNKILVVASECEVLDFFQVFLKVHSVGVLSQNPPLWKEFYLTLTLISKVKN